MKVFNTLISDDCSADKAENNSVVEKTFLKSFFFLCLKESVNVLCTASKISDTHCCGDTISMNFSKTFYLNATGKRS